MPLRTSLPNFAASLAGGLSLLLAACQAPGSTRIVGPDGSPMAHLHCGSDQGACFRMAGELCPSGYELKAVLSGNDGNFLVRCRAVSAPSATALAPKETRPPATEPPLMYPWPPPESSAAMRPKPATPTTPPGDVDIGY